MSEKEKINNIPEILSRVSYSEDISYVPTRFSLEFINFIKLVNGGEGEENKTPVLHYRMLDQLAGKDNRIANMLFRGSAKSTVFGEYLLLYLATFGGVLPNFGRIELALYISDSIDNGVKNMRKNIEYRWSNSEFLQHYVPEAKFTDIEWRFTNKDKDQFIVKGYGAKALSLDTVVYTPNGKTTIRECKVGQQIYGADGKLTNVVDKSKIFRNNMYKLVFDDGRTLKVNEDHINPVMLRDPKKGLGGKTAYNLTTKELLEVALERRPRWFRVKNVWVKSIEPIQYSEKIVPIDPYIYGLAITRGRFSQRYGVTLNIYGDTDRGIYEQIKHCIFNVALAGSARHTTESGHTNWTCHVAGSHKCKEVGYNIQLPQHERSILKTYMRASVAQRAQLLRGMADLNSEPTAQGYMNRFRHQSEQLVNDFIDLVRGLGGWAKKESSKNYRGSRVYRCVYTTPFNPHESKPKQEKVKPYRKHPALIYIQKIPNEPSQCIAVDNEEHEFVVGDFLRTHNTGIRGTKAMGKRPKLAIMDDLLSDEDARSPTEMSNIKDTIYKAVDYALHPTMNKIIWCGTPFNAKDPLYEAVESGAWAVNVFPVCEKFPCTKEEFRGAWEDRFTYEFVKNKYEKAVKEGMVASFNQELMLRIMSDDERLLEESCFRWYDRNALLRNKGNYNWYITTDFATTEKQSGDFSIISVWAYNSNGDWFWVDGIAKKQTMDKNIDDLFRLVSQYHPVSEVGIEVTGQQAGFIPWIQGEMLTRNIWFTLASKDNSNAPGIRPNTNKMQRFNIVVPWFKAGKMYFPINMDFHEALNEMLEELRLASAGGFKSKHDDAIDTISMLASLKTFKPNNESSLVRNAGDVYEESFGDDGMEGIGSYIV